eukprot:CAMPEP_0170551488 /NCGR_PEP_ID=MMETSP0211-20121228/9478_1 /TAXON_ID=311385 /ORGANISM="Pseudokeronopsis sp., Strain OXSARD2" /LENGTH=121 /DNA_ID=CAMNT_0010858677 /DNA_START=332 /DNA_END=697 /DNA_ORIENTATION=+
MGQALCHVRSHCNSILKSTLEFDFEFLVDLILLLGCDLPGMDQRFIQVEDQGLHPRELAQLHALALHHFLSRQIHLQDVLEEVHKVYIHQFFLVFDLGGGQDGVAVEVFLVVVEEAAPGRH